MSLYTRLFKITSHIFMSDKQTTVDLEVMKRNNIRGLLYLNDNSISTDVENNESFLNEFTKAHIQHYTINVTDEENIDFPKYFDRLNNIIKHFDTHNVNILVYCDTGTRLAPIAIASYLLYKFYVINNGSTNGDPAVITLLNTIKQHNPSIDYHNLNKTIEQLTLQENRLREKRDYNNKITESPDNQDVIEILK